MGAHSGRVCVCLITRRWVCLLVGDFVRLTLLIVGCSGLFLFLCFGRFILNVCLSDGVACVCLICCVSPALKLFWRMGTNRCTRLYVFDGIDAN